MIRLPNCRLARQAQAALRSYQNEVDAAGSYAEQVTAAKSRFRQYNTRRNAAFRVIRQTLARMCSGAQRCMYCEDSLADEVEHHHPKDIYPELAFAWSNYLYSCGPCNGPKRKYFAIIPNGGGEPINVAHPRRSASIPPLQGTSALIDPRREDPLDLLRLDLQTFYFVPAQANAIPRRRAEYTIQLLGLNDREPLRQSRESAFENYLARLVPPQR